MWERKQPYYVQIIAQIFILFYFPPIRPGCYYNQDVAGSGWIECHICHSEDCAIRAHGMVVYR